MAKYRELVVWQKANELAFQIYKLTDNFPRKESFGLTSQLRRAALSVPTNIVEGYGRRSKTDAETEYLIEFSESLGYIKGNVSEIKSLVEEVGKLLWNFQKSL